MSHLTTLTIQEAAHLIEKGDLSPVALAEAHLERIQRFNPLLNCYLTITAETALRAAERAEAEIRQGKYRGPLHGIPIGLKDLYDTQGIRTTAGSKFFTDWVPASDSAVAQALATAGTVLLGKQHMHEIALGVTNVNPHYGPCRNPWDLNRISGGSSGGSAVALAAGLCLGAMGSDTGGSIRIPASLCGVVGLKPTFGRVSKRGMLPLSWSLDHAGPMARSVADVALLFSAVVGYDPLDPYSVNAPVQDYLSGLADGVQGWRVAIADDPFFNDASLSALQAVQRAAQVFADLGARVTRVKPPETLLAARLNAVLGIAEAAAFHRDRLDNAPQDFGLDVGTRLLNNGARTPDEYALARKAQVDLRREWERFFEGYDLLLCPTTAIPAPLIEGQDAIEQARLLTRFTAPFNFTGLPAISVPCGQNGHSLPIGLQLVAAPWKEAALLQAAYAFEQAAPWQWAQQLLESETLPV